MSYKTLESRVFKAELRRWINILINSFIVSLATFGPVWIAIKTKNFWLGLICMIISLFILQILTDKD